MRDRDGQWGGGAKEIGIWAVEERESRDRHSSFSLINRVRC